MSYTTVRGKYSISANTNRILFVSVSAVGYTLPVESLVGAAINDIYRGNSNLEPLKRA